MKTKVYIEGMRCGHCVNHVKNALEEISGVQNVEVDLKGKYATFDSAEIIEGGKIEFALDDAGYEAVKIEQI